MLILKLLLKIILFPAVFVIFFIRWLIEVVMKLGELPLGLLLMVVGGGIVYYLFCRRWSDVFLMSLIFAGITVILAVCIFVQGLCDDLIQKFISL